MFLVVALFLLLLHVQFSSCNVYYPEKLKYFKVRTQLFVMLNNKLNGHTICYYPEGMLLHP